MEDLPAMRKMAARRFPFSKTVSPCNITKKGAVKKRIFTHSLCKRSWPPRFEGAGKTEGFDWGSVLSYGKTLPPSLPKGKATSLKEGGKASIAYSV